LTLRAASGPYVVTRVILLSLSFVELRAMSLPLQLRAFDRAPLDAARDRAVEATGYFDSRARTVI
jgi:hypothetical protein